MLDRFTFTGFYRVQSRRTYVPSTLAGTWLAAAPQLLDSERMNRALQVHPAWHGTAHVALRPARITHRTGQFHSQPDILYKRAFFTASPNTAQMPVDIVDVFKSTALWAKRATHVEDLFGQETYLAVLERLGNLPVVVANEYYLHEAGHFLGYDVIRKYDNGYFAVEGATAWPLIYLEELRADLHAFGLANELVPAVAPRVFLYNLFLRLGGHFAGIRDSGVAPYGTISYLLFHLLSTIGYLHVERTGSRSRIALASLDSTAIRAVMTECADHAMNEITHPEASSLSLLDSRMCGARYVRRRIEDTKTADAFQKVMGCE